MERKLALSMMLVLAVGLGVAVGLVQAQPLGGPAAPAVRTRDWYDYADVVLRICTLVVLAGGLVGTFALLTSLRAGAYGQIYGRFQTVLLKMMEHPQVFESMKRDSYTLAEDDPTNPNASANPRRFLANCLVNLYEEAYFLHESRVLMVIDTVPDDYWISMLGSMRATFRLQYVRTHWEVRQAVFSPKFNDFVRREVLAANA